ncbi:Rrf2 family transcriptional regulator [Limosilactobacillus fermentum]
MRASTRFSDAIHILCFLKVYEEARITSDLLSSSIGISPVMVRRLMGNLRQAGLVQTTQGTAQPRLARDLQKITLYDVYLAVEESDGPHPSSTLTPILTPSVRSVVTFNQS